MSVCKGAYLEIEAEVVDGNGVFAGVVLHHSGEESLCEEETRYPEHCRLSVIVPVLHRTYTCIYTVIRTTIIYRSHRKKLAPYDLLLITHHWLCTVAYLGGGLVRGPPFGRTAVIFVTILGLFFAPFRDKIAATSDQMRFLPENAPKCSKMRLRPGLRPGPRWGSLQRSPGAANLFTADSRRVVPAR